MAQDPMIGRIVGSYRLDARLGQGGMGQVYRAVHPAIGSRVAIKVLTPDAAARRDLVERFFGEARVVNHIRHPNIVGVLDLGQLDDGRPYILMELLEGASLAELLLRRGPLPLATVVDIGRQVLAGLGAAHAAGVVHRDIKPDNVFVQTGGRVKVLDFGIAKLEPEMSAGSTGTRTGALLGTPCYMAPEQVACERVDAQADVYAVGALLFEALTGRPPFVGGTVYELFRQHLREAPPRPRALRPEIPAALEEAVLRALAKLPADRPPGAAGLDALLAAIPAPLLADAHPGVGPTQLDPFSTPASPAPQGGGRFGGVGSTAASAPTFAAHGTPLTAVATLPMAAPPRGGPRWPLAIAVVLPLVAVGAGGVYWATRTLAKKPAHHATDAETEADDAEEREAEEEDEDLEMDSGSLIATAWPPYDATHADVDQLVTGLRPIAEQHIGPVELAQLAVTGVAGDGFANLTLGPPRSLFSVVFHRPDGSKCVQFQVVGPIRTAMTMTGSICHAERRPQPRCRVAAVVARAPSLLATNVAGSVATVHFPSAGGKPVWTVLFASGAGAEVPDGC
jgi:eukaryotic-like serine/threonine-protein kinase